MKLEKIDILDFNENVFKIIGKDYALLAAGDLKHHNAMTIGWGGLGFLWRKNVSMIFVKPTRYTYDFTEASDTYSINFFTPEDKEIISVFGSKSGRDCDKDVICNMEPIMLDGAIAYANARLVIVCKKIYHHDFDEALVPEDVKNMYYKDQKFHRVYYGEVISIYQAK